MLGKIIGGVLGFSNFGFFGGLVCIVVGHVFDRLIRVLAQRESPEALQAIQSTFFKTTFTLIGYLAKADGRVSQEEIDQTQQLMDKMGLTADHKREAILLFKQGAEPSFVPTELLVTFKRVCGHRVQLTQMLMVYLINTALADGTFDSKEEEALRQVAQGLNFSHVAFEQLIKMIGAQGSFSGAGGQAYSANELTTAYAALGVSENDSDMVIKKAYRKLMSENHPDKLIGQGVPDDMIRMATERSQTVQAAYDLVKKYRKR